MQVSTKGAFGHFGCGFPVLPRLMSTNCSLTFLGNALYILYLHGYKGKRLLAWLRSTIGRQGLFPYKSVQISAYGTSTNRIRLSQRTALVHLHAQGLAVLFTCTGGSGPSRQAQ